MGDEKNWHSEGGVGHYSTSTPAATMNGITDVQQITESNLKGSRPPYANYFHFKNREVAEWGVANTFLREAVDGPSFPLSGLESHEPGSDPPDCEARDCRGHRIGIEIMELVDQQLVAGAARLQASANASSVYLSASWNAATFLEKLQACLTAKDAKTLLGGKYDEYFVILHTDEPLLSRSTVEGWLQGHRFATPTQINRAYLLLSYDPSWKGCPYFRLNFLP